MWGEREWSKREAPSDPVEMKTHRIWTDASHAGPWVAMRCPGFDYALFFFFGARRRKLAKQPRAPGRGG